MRQHYLSLVFGLFALGTNNLSAQEVKPPDLETYAASAATADFIRAAQGFLEHHPTSVHAPRTALDLLMMAERTGDTALVKRSKGTLLFTYPQSIQSHHVLASFADATAFRDFIMNQAKERLAEQSETLPADFVKIVQLATKRFQGTLFDDVPFLIMTYCLAEAAGHSQLCQAILPALKSKGSEKPDMAPVVDICLDSQSPLVDRIDQLHNTRSKHSRFLLQFYLTRLSESQQQNPRIRRIGMEFAMESHEYKLALDHYQHLPEDVQSQPQVMFWRSWALMATQENRRACETLTDLIADHGTSAWAETARLYLAGLQAFDTRFQDQTERFLAATQVLKDDLSQLQARILFTRKHGDRFMIHICSSSRENLFELAIEKNGRLAAAYRTNAQDALFYLPSRDEIVRWPKAGPIPMPNIELDRNADGSFTMNAQLGFEANLRQVGNKGLRILDSPYLSTPDGIKSYIGRMVRRGGLIPGAPQTKPDGNIQYLWWRPQADDPALLPFTITLTPSHRVSALTAGSVQLRSLQYGAADSFDLQPYTWPELAQRSLEQADFTMILNMMGAVMEIFKKPDTSG